MEPLEPRIAPAAVSVTYSDLDGDLVKITADRAGTAAPPLDVSNLAFVGGGASGQLATLDLTDPAFGGAAIIFTVTKKVGGDGLAHVGFINATGVDLDRVIVKGDLGRIVAGDATTSGDPGLNLLQVRTMGTLGLVTGAANLSSTITGKLGALKVAGDFTAAFLFVTVPAGGSSADAQIGSVFIGGDLVGGPGFNSGSIQCFGAMGDVRIGGDVFGGAGDTSGRVSSRGMGNVRIGGDVVGSSGTQSGTVETAGAMGNVQIGGDLIAGADPGNSSGEVQSSGGAMGNVRVGGRVSGEITSASAMGDVQIGGDLTGSLRGVNSMGSLRIGGDVGGGANVGSGQIRCLSGTIARVQIGGSLFGSEGIGSGAIDAFSIGDVRIARDLIGGQGSFSGRVSASFDIGHVRIGGDFIGGSIEDTASLDDSGSIESDGSIASVTIGGSFIAGTDASSGTLTRSGFIGAGDALGPVRIGGSIIGSSTNAALIVARGQEVKPATGFDTAIASLSVGGDVRFAEILAGFDRNQAPANADASIGPVSAGRDWAASSLVAGAQDAGDPGFGIDDTLQTAANTGLVARIARITIKGDATGSLGAGDHFGFVAEQIDKISIAAVPFLLNPGAGNDNVPIPFTNDLRLLEVS